jgi:predicted ester cyclase
MSLDENKARARRTLEAAFNHGDLDAVDQGFTPDALIHDPGGLEMRGLDELKQGLKALLRAFPDFHFTVEDELAEGDKVSIRFRGQGTHRSEFLGLAATSRPFNYTGIVIVQMQAGKIAEWWASPDQLGLLKQLGARVTL